MTTSPDSTPETELRTERDRFGGVKPGSAFFGWLTATGMIVLIVTVLAAAGYGTGLVDGGTSGTADVADNTALNSEQVGWVGVGIAIAVLVLAYYSGGYVAARMARFDGVRQGVAVIVWTIVVAVVLAVVGAVAGSEYNVLRDLTDSLRLPDLDQLSAQTIVLVAGGVGGAIIGAILGGLAGMRFHRRVDRAALVR